MTKQQLEKFEEMQDLFQIRCEIVCDILSPLKDSYNHVYEFSIDGDDVCGWGEETWQYGGYEEYSVDFPKEYIYMDDSEIQKIVDDELKRRADVISRKKANDEKLKAEKEKAEYERLKKIYG